MAEENQIEKNKENHSKLIEYIYAGIAIGIGTLLIWVIDTTNDNTKMLNDHSKDISNIQKDHTSEVGRSSDVDKNQKERIDKNENKLDSQLELIHSNHRTIGILIDRGGRDGKDLPPTDYGK